MKNLRPKRTRSGFALGLTALLSWSGCASGPSIQVPDTPWAKVVKSETVPWVGAFQVQRSVLGNGLRLLVVEDHSSPTFAYQTWYSVGSRDEVPGRTGLAHLFEHLMFKATSNHPEGEFDRILETAGVEDENAFTTQNYTAFFQELPIDKLDLIASLESDRMVNLVVNDESFKTEREVVQNERRYRNENNPSGKIFEKLYELAFTKSPYHWPVIGYEQDLNAMTAQDPMNFYHAYYSPNHATVIVIGDVNPDTVLKTVQKYYGNIPPQNAPEHVIVAEPAQTASRHETVPLNIQVEKLEMGYKVPSVTDTDIPALDVLDAVLTGGKAARLQRALVDAGIAQSIDTGVEEAKDPSLFLFDCTLQEGKRAAQAESVILRILRQLGRDPISDSEMARAKNRAQFQFYQGLQSSTDKANFLGRYSAMTGSFETGLEIQKKMLEVTPARLQTVVQKYFSPGNRTVITGVMKMKKLFVAAVVGIAAIGLGGSALSVAYASSQHGIEVAFEEDSSLPMVFLNVALKTGANSDPWKELGLTNFVGEMLLRGTTEKNKEQIDLSFDQIGAQFEVETRNETMIFRGAVMSSQLDPFLALVKEILTRPSFPDAEIDKLKAEVESQILEEHSSDERLAGLAFSSFLFGDHPYGKPILGKLKTVKGITRDNIISHYGDLFTDDMILVVGSGDAPSDKIETWAKSLGETLPDHAKHIATQVQAPQNSTGMRLLLVDKPDRTQTQITGGQVGIQMTDPNFFPLYLGNEAFGGGSFSSRMMSQIRVQRGWSYGAYSYFKYAREPRSWQFYLFPAEKDTPAALAYTLGMVHKLKDSGITPAEFDYSKRVLVNSSGFMYNTPAKRVENTLTEKILGLPDGFMKSYGPEISKVTLPEVNDALRSFLRPNDLSIVVVGTAPDLKSKLAQASGIPESQITVVPYSQE